MLLSCKEKQGRQLPEKYLKTDTILDGKVRTFDPYKRLVSIAYYKNGVKDGIYINYHSNQKVYDSITYVNGLKNGIHYVYDSTGSLGYSDFYYYGHQLGPIAFYNQGRIKNFYFSSFEKYEVYRAHYDNFGKIISSQGRLINASIYTTRVGGIPSYGVFCYLIYPPGLNLKYELVMRDTAIKNKEILVSAFTNKNIFIDSILDLPKENYLYSIKVVESDSNNNEKKIFYEDLIFQ